MSKHLKVTMFYVILSHLVNVMLALEVSWYIVYQSILAIAQKSQLCIRDFVVIADPFVFDSQSDSVCVIMGHL